MKSILKCDFEVSFNIIRTLKKLLKVNKHNQMIF